MKKLIPIFLSPVFLFVVACETSGPSTARLIDAQCRAGTSMINIMSSLKAQGKLSEQNIKDVDAAIAIVDPICSSTERPTGTAYLTTLQMGVLQLQGVQTNLGK